MLPSNFHPCGIALFETFQMLEGWVDPHAAYQMLVPVHRAVEVVNALKNLRSGLLPRLVNATRQNLESVISKLQMRQTERVVGATM